MFTCCLASLCHQGALAELRFRVHRAAEQVGRSIQTPLASPWVGTASLDRRKQNVTSRKVF